MLGNSGMVEGPGFFPPFFSFLGVGLSCFYGTHPLVSFTSIIHVDSTLLDRPGFYTKRHQDLSHCDLALFPASLTQRSA